MSIEQEDKIRDAFALIQEATNMLSDVENDLSTKRIDDHKNTYPGCEMRGCDTTCTTPYLIFNAVTITICPVHLQVWQRFKPVQELNLKLKRAKFEMECAKQTLSLEKDHKWKFAMEKYQAWQALRIEAEAFIFSWLGNE